MPPCVQILFMTNATVKKLTFMAMVSIISNACVFSVMPVDCVYVLRNYAVQWDTLYKRLQRLNIKSICNSQYHSYLADEVNNNLPGLCQWNLHEMRSGHNTTK